MTGPDELERMRRANPWPSERVPATSPAARELAEEIMTTTKTEMSPEAPPKGRRPLLALVAAAALAVGAVGVGIALTAGDSEPSEVAAPDPGTGSDPAGTTEMCIEVYDLTTLPNREYAFDGTVLSVSDDTFTFEVAQWFHGGSGDTVTLEGAASFGAFSSIGTTTEVEPGTRLLVAGDGGFAWTCGFTQPYDEAVAQDWADAFGG